MWNCHFLFYIFAAEASEFCTCFMQRSQTAHFHFFLKAAFFPVFLAFASKECFGKLEDVSVFRTLKITASLQASSGCCTRRHKATVVFVHLGQPWRNETLISLNEKNSVVKKSEQRCLYVLVCEVFVFMIEATF